MGAIITQTTELKQRCYTRTTHTSLPKNRTSVGIGLIWTQPVCLQVSHVEPLVLHRYSHYEKNLTWNLPGNSFS